MTIHVIGAGGGASWLLPKLVKIERDPRKITIWDADTLETRNLDRQLFRAEDIGRNKAEALASMHGTRHVPEFWHSQAHRMRPQDWIIACADNHRSRLETCIAVDEYDCRAILGGNALTDAEAYVYLSDWRDTPNDPRIRYPEILEPDPYDPIGACTGPLVEETTPQLALANDLTAIAKAHLYRFWHIEKAQLDPAQSEYWPVWHKITIWGFSTVNKGA